MVKQHQKTFADLMGDFANKPYHKTGRGEDGVDGYSCLGLCYAYLKKKGVDVPDSFDGLTLDTLPDYAKFNKGRALRTLLRLFQSYGTEIPSGQKMAGDVILIKVQNETYPGIYVGNGQFMAAYLDAGVKVLPFNNNMQILSVRRF